MDAPIYARTSGYLKKWYVDIGARVKANQLLAEIETPEVDQQLQQARADLNTAEANLTSFGDYRETLRGPEKHGFRLEARCGQRAR